MMKQAANTDKDTVRVAGRGVIYITFAKLWFLITGYALTFGLPRIFKWESGGDAEQGQILFGAYKLVFMGVSFINNGIVTGTIQAVSRFTSQDEPAAAAIRYTALKVQAVLGLSIAALYALFAGLLADLLKSPELAYLMRVSAGVIAAYSCYSVFIGSFNGQRLFNRQALFDISYATIKTGLIIGLAAAGFKVLGTVVGFLAASVLIMIAAAAVFGIGRPGNFPMGKYLAFSVTLILYTFLLNVVMSLDLFLLKGFSSHLALESGFSTASASALGKALTGRYGAAQGLAFIPYQAILSIAFVAFPLISKVTSDGDKIKTQAYIRKAMRFTAILIVGMATVFAALPKQSLGLIFPSEYQVAAAALRILSLGIAAFGLMAVSNTVLNGAGLPKKAYITILTTLTVLTVAVVLLLLGATPDNSTLTAAATGSTVGMLTGLVVSGMLVYREFGAFIQLKTAVRVVLAGAVGIALGECLPNAGKLFSLLECALVFAVYFVVLIVSREFKREDIQQLKRILSKK
jgi:O-antigen/teichoic acid export membrane protein